MGQAGSMRCRSFAVIAALALCACGIGGNIDRNPAAPSAPAERSAEADPGSGVDGIRVLYVGTAEYSYRLYATAETIAAGPVPVVISLHGGGATAEGHDTYTRLRDKAASARFALLTPNGTSFSWNAGSCCDPSTTLGVDHVAAVSAMIDDAATVIALDPKRVFATGHSNGGMMVYRLACELSDRIAAVAPNAAVMMTHNLDTDPPTEIYACNPGRAVPVLAIHGLADRCTPFEGGVSAGDGSMRAPASESIDFWMRRNLCERFPDADWYNGRAHCSIRYNCGTGASVGLCTIENAGHIWPGNGVPPDPDDACGGEGSDDLVANDLIWDFFSRHPMP